MKRGLLSRCGDIHLEKNGVWLPVRCVVFDRDVAKSCNVSCSLLKPPKKLASGTKFFDGDIASSNEAVEIRTCCTKFQFQELVDHRDKTQSV